MLKHRSNHGQRDLDQFVVEKRPQPAQPAAAQGQAPAPHTHREPLSAWGQQLLKNLPKGLSLEQTVKYYPHVVNKLALVWDNARDLDLIIDELLLDDRPQRQGFPLEVLTELTEARRVRVAMLDPRRPHRF